VIYPIPKQFIDRFLKKGREIVKPATVWKQLSPRMKFVLSAGLLGWPGR